MSARLHLVSAEMLQDYHDAGTAGDPARTIPGRKWMRVEVVVEVDADADYAEVTNAVGQVIWESR